MVKNLDVKSPQRIFSSYVASRYREYILSKNEDFFLTTSTEEIEIHSTRKEYWVEFISYIRSIWKTLDTENKDVIWKYFHVLLVLSDKCQE
jgi:hypothetical protein